MILYLGIILQCRHFEDDGYYKHEKVNVFTWIIQSISIMRYHDMSYFIFILVTLHSYLTNLLKINVNAHKSVV